MIQIYCVQPKRNLKLTKQLLTSYANVSYFIDELIENMYFIALKYNILNNNFLKRNLYYMFLPFAVQIDNRLSSCRDQLKRSYCHCSNDEPQAFHVVLVVTGESGLDVSLSFHVMWNVCIARVFVKFAIAVKHYILIGATRHLTTMAITSSSGISQMWIVVGSLNVLGVNLCFLCYKCMYCQISAINTF